MPDNDDNQELVTLTIDGRQVSVRPGTTVLRAAEKLGIDIPVFCAHPKLEPVGMCRMCLVEIERAPTLQTACTLPVQEGMVVRTDSPEALQGRREQLEFLLLNHPLDCPVCDEGGECPLQDLTYKWGPVQSRYPQQWKRHFEKPVDLGAHILLDRERCIMCGRCVRFCREIAAHPVLAVIERGDQSYIDTDSDPPFDTQFSCNTVEICPVGALTTKQYRFKSRPWEYGRTYSICARCGMGCNVELHWRDRKLRRVESHEHPEVDDGWLCDEGCFGTVEAATYRPRLTRPACRRDRDLEEHSWDETLDWLADRLSALRDRGEPIAGLVSATCTNEETFALRAFIEALRGSVHLWPPNKLLAAALRRGLSNASIRDLAEAERILLFGSDPSRELPVLDLWLKKAVTKLGARLVVVHGQEIELDRHAERIFRAGLDQFNDALYACGEGEVVVIVGPEAVPEEQIATLLDRVQELHEQRKARALFVAREANAVGALDMGVSASLPPGQTKALYVLGADPLADGGLRKLLARLEPLIVQDHAPTETSKLAHFSLPGAHPAEKDGTMTSTERRIQRLRGAVPPPGDARPDLEIIAELASRLDIALPAQSAQEWFAQIAREVPGYAPFEWSKLADRAAQRSSRRQP
ncbi:MAG: NADH-quinone oxidoreductase subunit NuoG [Armatimonadota bacterium]